MKNMFKSSFYVASMIALSACSGGWKKDPTVPGMKMGTVEKPAAESAPARDSIVIPYRKFFFKEGVEEVVSLDVNLYQPTRVGQLDYTVDLDPKIKFAEVSFDQVTDTKYTLKIKWRPTSQFVPPHTPMISLSNQISVRVQGKTGGAWVEAKNTFDFTVAKRSEKPIILEIQPPQSGDHFTTRVDEVGREFPQFEEGQTYDLVVLVSDPEDVNPTDNAGFRPPTLGIVTGDAEKMNYVRLFGANPLDLSTDRPERVPSNPGVWKYTVHMNLTDAELTSGTSEGNSVQFYARSNEDFKVKSDFKPFEFDVRTSLSQEPVWDWNLPAVFQIGALNNMYFNVSDPKKEAEVHVTFKTDCQKDYGAKCECPVNDDIMARCMIQWNPPLGVTKNTFELEVCLINKNVLIAKNHFDPKNPPKDVNGDPIAVSPCLHFARISTDTEDEEQKAQAEKFDYLYSEVKTLSQDIVFTTTPSTGGN